MANASEIHRRCMDSWNRRDWDTMRSLFHPDYKYMGGDGKELSGPDAGLKVAKTYASAFPDGKMEIKNVTEAGNTSVTEFVARGTHKGDLNGIAPTNKSIQIHVCNVIEVRDGKIYREREYFDALTMMIQLGVVQPPGAKSPAA